jgi:Histidyl-tRNA synthetase
MNKKLSTQPYKGVRDFYPEDMAVQQYLFDIWVRTAESFGFQRYDASVLEPAELYQAKGAVNEELVSEQTYTFTDRGEREVTLRPEMTPTVARMIAARAKELAWPVRWYSIPNLFRYERMQRGRLREHWQLNCDIFGVRDTATDVEIIALAYEILMNFGATDKMFTIHINDRH